MAWTDFCPHQDILETNGIAWPNQQMWRRPQNNPAMPVPTYHPDDGSDSHIHSPRRKSYGCGSTGSSNVAMPNMSSTLMPQIIPGLNHASFPEAISAYQKTSGTSSSSGYVDPFNDAAYKEWIASMGSAQQQQVNFEPKTIWPGAVTRNSSKTIGHDMSTSMLPEFMASTMDQTIGSDQVGMPSIGLDEDLIMDDLKVPTNTPITATDGSAGPTGLSSHPTLALSETDEGVRSAQLSYDFPNPAISSDLAQSLTHSLLNQPHPLQGTSQTAQAQQIPLPASEVRSRKENRHLNNASSTRSSSSNPSPSVEAQIRKFSQTGTAFGVIAHDRDSSGNGPTYSRRTSAGEFGTNITNQATTPLPVYTGAATSGPAPGSGSEKGTKRSRIFEPAGSKAITEDDEPCRPSPGMRAATMVSGNHEGQDQVSE